MPPDKTQKILESLTSGGFEEFVQIVLSEESAIRMRSRRRLGIPSGTSLLTSFATSTQDRRSYPEGGPGGIEDASQFTAMEAQELLGGRALPGTSDGADDTMTEDRLGETGSDAGGDPTQNRSQRPKSAPGHGVRPSSSF